MPENKKQQIYIYISTVRLPRWQQIIITLYYTDNDQIAFTKIFAVLDRANSLSCNG